MSTTVRELINIIGWKINDNELKSAEAKTKKFMNVLGKVGLAVGASIVGIGIAAINAAADMEALTAQFEVMLGSSEKAIALMDELKVFAAKTPFALKDLAQGTQNLISFGVPLEDTVETMRMLGDTAGGNSEKLQSLVLAYGKVQTKGKVSMEEINMIAERGVPIIKTLQEQLGVTEQEFFKLLSAGKVSRDHIKKAFQTMTTEGGIFFKGMETASLTFKGLVSTMKDNISMVLGMIGSKLLPTMKIVIQTITELFQGSLGDIISNLLSVIDPLLKIVLELMQTILKGLNPIIKTLVDLLVPLLEIVAILLEPINEVLGLLLELLGDIIGEMGVLLIPLFEELANALKAIMTRLMPIIRIMTKLFGIFFKMKTLTNSIFFKILIKGITLLLKLLTPLIELLNKFLVPAFEKFEKVVDNLSKFIDDMFQNLTKGITRVLGFIFGMINKAIGAINKLPFMKNKQIQPLDLRALEEKVIKKEETKQKNEIKMTANNTFNGVDINRKGTIKNEVRQAIGTPFQIEILRVIQEL